MKLSENFRKTDEILLEAQFRENQTKNITTKICNIFRKLFGGFSVNYWETVGDYYLNKYPTILVPYFSQAYLSKHAKGGGQKKDFHSGPIMRVSYFGLWVSGPYNFPCCVGWVPLPFQKASGSTFSSKSHSF